MAVPSKPNERWSADFRARPARRWSTHTDLERGRRLLERVCKSVGRSVDLGCAHGSTPRSAAEHARLTQDVGARQRTGDSFVESFNGRFRDGCLNQHWFVDLADARGIVAA